MTIDILNLVFHLHLQKKIVFSEWLILNQACYEEFGLQAGGLRPLVRNPEDPIFKELEREFKAGFLCMSDKDEQSLDVHKGTFKEEKRRYAIVTYAIKTYSDDISNWRQAHSAIAYYYERAKQKKRNTKDNN